jgi:endonuclease YncB( thermonuclease family)
MAERERQVLGHADVSASLWLIFFVCFVFVVSCVSCCCGEPFAERIRDSANSRKKESRMQFLHVLLVSTIAFLQTSPLVGRVGRSDFVLVRSVIDGDTIVVSTVGRVRLLGIDAPEIGHGLDTSAPFGREARDRLTGLLLHRWVRLEQDGRALDTYNRHLAYVVTGDGTFVNATMVREGLARVSTREPLTRLNELQRAEAEAQAFRRGMWGSAPQIASAGYTRRSKASRHPTSRIKTPSSKRRSTRKKKP